MKSSIVVMLWEKRKEDLNVPSTAHVWLDKRYAGRASSAETQRRGIKKKNEKEQEERDRRQRADYRSILQLWKHVSLYSLRSIIIFMIHSRPGASQLLPRSQRMLCRRL